MLCLVPPPPHRPTMADLADKREGSSLSLSELRRAELHSRLARNFISPLLYLLLLLSCLLPKEYTIVLYTLV